MTNYLHPDVIARAQVLGLKARTIVEGLRVGDHRSPYRGFSVEFVQHREYVPGDDLRYIDWKSYGRSERYTIKQYEQETNFAGHILLDASRSMLYGSGDTNKLEYAKLLAAALAYLVVHQRDSVSLNVFDADWRERLPASGQPGHVQTILHTLESVEPRDKTAIAPLLHDLAQQVRRRGLVFLISDCFDDVPALLDGLQHLRFQGHEVTLFHILHPEEVEFPFGGMVKFDGMEEKLQLLTRPQLVRPAYLRALDKYLKELQAGCEANRVDYVLLNTAKPLAESLIAYLARRLKVRIV
ncbi:MAG: DUF58 domain-containing protein [Gemmataceae bacterium]|nr:DUF58 domain-containing protein [Gemmataceae bacterium]MCI0739837.1 DUF58 domain-containing protein [Gemmataceae bacterium]